jgi:hypothetical protein
MKISVDQFHYNGRSEYGNRFFFLLPFVNICHYKGYAYISTGWLTLNLVITADWRKKQVEMLNEKAVEPEIPDSAKPINKTKKAKSNNER